MGNWLTYFYCFAILFREGKNLYIYISDVLVIQRNRFNTGFICAKNILFLSISLFDSVFFFFVFYLYLFVLLQPCIALVNICFVLFFILFSSAHDSILFPLPTPSCLFVYLSVYLSVYIYVCLYGHIEP